MVKVYRSRAVDSARASSISESQQTKWADPLLGSINNQEPGPYRSRVVQRMTLNLLGSKKQLRARYDRQQGYAVVDS